MKRLSFLCLCAAAIALASPVDAHPVPFSFVDVRIERGALEVSVVAHVFDLAHDLDLQPPERLLEASTLGSQADAITALIKSRLQLSVGSEALTNAVWSAPEPLAERQSIQLRARITIAASPGRVLLTTLMFPYDPVHQTFVNFYEGGSVATQAILDRDRTSIEFFASSLRGVQSIAARLVPIGIEHIVFGPEHLLFLFGLLLLGGPARLLVLAVTAFTLAQAATLTLAAFNLVTPSLRFVEPGIGLSIVYLGADNLMVRGGRDVRVWIASAFGFMHGFDFAGVLRHMDLSRRALGWSILSFSVGVQIVQVAIVVALAVALGALRSRNEAAGRRLAFAGSIVVIAAGTIWFIQRVFFPGGLA
jgi:hydrogenase/urease accessory protein HupE